MKTKALTTLTIICLIGCFAACNGQTKPPTSESLKLAKSTQKDTVKQKNLLDEQTKVFSQIFELAGTGEDNPAAGASSYLELLGEMNLPAAQKEILYEQYKIYDLSLDPIKKGSLKIMVNKMLKTAIEKSQSEH